MRRRRRAKASSLLHDHAESKPSLSGAVVSAQATVVFDTNRPISTAVVSNTIDTTVPTSSVEALPATTTAPSFTVSWSGSDGAGSGIASYDVFVSTNGGPFQPFETGTTATSATFIGQIGDTYGFYSVATSNVGLVQPTPKLPQATTMVITKPSPPPLVTVESLQIEKEKVGKGTKAKKENVLVLQFSGPLTAATADSLGAYGLAPIIKVKAHGKGKHRQPATIKLGKVVTPVSAVYAAATNRVTLTPRGTLNLTKPEELVVRGALVTDALGRPIDGNDDGQAGGDYIATIKGGRATAGGGVPLARTRTESDAASMASHAIPRATSSKTSLTKTRVPRKVGRP